MEKTKLKKTEYSFMVCGGMNCYNGIWKRVWEDANGRYVVKHGGELIDVTFAKKDFVKD